MTFCIHIPKLLLAGLLLTPVCAVLIGINELVRSVLCKDSAALWRKLLAYAIAVAVYVVAYWMFAVPLVINHLGIK
jgi:hypothetical protein